jgi:hypothetical protein
VLLGRDRAHVPPRVELEMPSESYVPEGFILARRAAVARQQALAILVVRDPLDHCPG